MPNASVNIMSESANNHFFNNYLKKYIDSVYQALFLLNFRSLLDTHDRHGSGSHQKEILLMYYRNKIQKKNPYRFEISINNLKKLNN